MASTSYTKSPYSQAKKQKAPAQNVHAGAAAKSKQGNAGNKRIAAKKKAVKPGSGGKFDRSKIKWNALTVKKNGKPMTVKTQNLNRAQIIRALSQKENRNALQSGWEVRAGKIVRRAAAPTAATQPAPATTQADPNATPTNPAPVIDKDAATALTGSQTATSPASVNDPTATPTNPSPTPTSETTSLEGGANDPSTISDPPEAAPTPESISDTPEDLKPVTYPNGKDGNKAAVKWKSLYVTDKNGKLVPKLVSNMSDREIREALKTPQNKNAINTGYRLNDDGRIVKGEAPATDGSGTGGDTGDAPTLWIPEQEWSEQNSAYDMSKGSLKGVIRDFNSPSGWSVIDQWGRMRPVGSRKLALEAGYNDISKEQILNLNPSFYTGEVSGTENGDTGTGTTQPAVEPWMRQMFPQLFPAAPQGPTTNPSAPAGGSAQYGGMNAQQLLGGPQGADAQYLADRSDILMTTMQGLRPGQTELQALTAVNPNTNQTMYQELIANEQRAFRRNSSAAIADANRRGIFGSGMANSNFAQVGSQYATAATNANNTVGDNRLGQVQQDITQGMNDMQVELYGAWQAYFSRQMQALPTVGASTQIQ